ncbi:phytochrome-like protein cph2 [Clostridium tepidiprofundi DSM 19306]|uniref:Phytochrome-like protein cph2 n=1 Tax=Clostridium tepidiprofundi DSM 19306 TaxID=1121338 RepID=A0A151B5Z1_9CLOT|nr:EAL domain-containing protein [Clostridium tepidiprofundi]KYH35358.1 phytochrome-like protein cph2 [Clostridium tepidiprofundi DSM 19306]
MLTIQYDLEKNLYDAIKKSNVMMVLWDTKGNIVDLSNYINNFVEASRNSILSEYWENNILPYKSSLNEDVNSFENEFIIKSNDKIINVFCTNQIIYDEYKNVKFILTIGMDITKAKKYEKSINTSSHHKSFENEIRYALKHEQFSINYQPQVDVKTGKLVGMEALIRWFHPSKGFISPSKFIPIAEETGLISEIDDYVIRTACKQNKLWQDLGYYPIPVSVNISALQFQNPNLIKNIKDALTESCLEPKWLKIEITESTAIKNFKHSTEILKQLNDLGIKISLDDFGTGYSSLNYLTKLPIDSLKIDKSFIDEISTNNRDRAITNTVIELAHTLNLDVIAEGVEKNDQLEILSSQNCDIIQGFLFSKPLSADNFENLLNKVSYIN